MAHLQPQYQDVMERCGKYADSAWKEHGQFIAGLKGYQATHLQAVRFSHPPFPVFSYLLASCIPLSNGSLIKLWGNWSPVSLWVLNVNYSQTRKSCLTTMAENMVGPVDQALVQRLEKIWDAKRKATDNPAGKAKRAKKEEREEDHGEDEIAAGAPDEASRAAGEGGAVNFPGVWSVSFLGGTIDRCKERCSGNFSQLKQTKSVMKLAPISKEVLDAAVGKATDADHSLAEKFGMSGRLWFSQVLLFDEIYGFLQELSMLDVPNQRKGDDSASGQTPNAGWANRLLQCGKSDHETKTLGCHGGAGAPPVGCAVLGNFHPSVAVEMQRGLRGDHGCQTKARVCFTTGLPVQPHQEYESIGVEAKVAYYPIPSILWGEIGLGEVFETVETAKEFFGRHADEAVGENGPWGLSQEGNTYVPNVAGASCSLMESPLGSASR